MMLALTPFDQRFHYDQFSGVKTELFQGWDTVVAYHIPPNVLSLIGLSCVVAAMWVLWLYLRKPKGEYMVVPNLQDASLKFVMGEILIEGIEKAVARGLLTRSQANDAYYLAAKAFAIKELLPVKVVRTKLSRKEIEKLKSSTRQRLHEAQEAEGKAIVVAFGSALKRKA